MKRLAWMAVLGIAVVVTVRVLDWVAAPVLPALETLLIVAAVAMLITGGRWSR
ncbi:MAG: hypothetical protein IPK24_18995 [Kineosporiaceae bacterium]|nr:hypothetical protein [Kineosporiaceae bacterium]MBK8077594.1 hypothetical protein [Kineosporiaceae bacterium]